MKIEKWFVTTSVSTARRPLYLRERCLAAKARRAAHQRERSHDGGALPDVLQSEPESQQRGIPPHCYQRRLERCRTYRATPEFRADFPRAPVSLPRPY